MMVALNYKIAPKTFRGLVVDYNARFQERPRADTFLEILNEQDPARKYTAKFEGHNDLLNFLDINIASNTPKKKMKIQSTLKVRNHKNIY